MEKFSPFAVTNQNKVNIFIDINVAAVEAEFAKFQHMNKGIIDLIPAAVEAVKQETAKKMKLFSSDGKADVARVSDVDTETIARLVAAEVAKYLKK